MKVALLVLVLLAVAVAVLLALAGRRWRSASAAAVERLKPGSATAGVSYSPSELSGLPAPVARYLRAVLREGQPLVRSGRLIQNGEFLLRPTPDGWRPFTATHHFSVAPPGFVWDASIRMMPGVAIRARDAFVEGNGSMRVSILGVFTFLDVRGTPEITAAALQRHLAEAVWFPTALLPSQGVRWTPVDESHARATLTVGAASVWLDFEFDEDGLVRSVFTPARGRDVNGRSVPTPWQGRWFEYAEHDGMRVPVRGEVEWVLPEGPQVYWRGRVTSISYEYHR